ncbi:MAG: PLDc N-terminal domain-containing protein [Anaerolineales bacterium]|nr:PLDc N-terminal domain-containing protein [Anaerolineales bacterium]
MAVWVLVIILVPVLGPLSFFMMSKHQQNES